MGDLLLASEAGKEVCWGLWKISFLLVKGNLCKDRAPELLWKLCGGVMLEATAAIL